MSHTIRCDGGCGVTSSNPGDFENLGIIIQKEYCSKCSVVIKEYLDAKDELHDKLALQWSKKVSKLTSTYKKKLPDGILPDE